MLHLRLRAAALGGTATAMRCAVAVMRCAVLLRSAANFFSLGAISLADVSILVSSKVSNPLVGRDSGRFHWLPALARRFRFSR